MASNHKRFFLHKVGGGKGRTLVIIRDRENLVDAIIDGRPTKMYAPVSKAMPYLDAYPIMLRMNEENQV